MYSLFNFRQLNLRSRQTVDSLKQYQVLYGLNLLCALLRTGLAIGVSLVDLYYALCTKARTLCGEFAGFISLDAVFHASKGLRKPKCKLLPLSGSNST